MDLRKEFGRLMERACVATVQIFDPTCVVIQDLEGRPYLNRYYLLHVAREWLPGVFLHFFHRGDADRDTHHHPWSASVSLILSGGYVEERLVEDSAHPGLEFYTKRRTFRPGSVNIIRADDFHRVDLLDPRGCWSLFIAGKRRQRWGFKVRETGEYIDHEEYERRKYAQKKYEQQGAAP